MNMVRQWLPYWAIMVILLATIIGRISTWPMTTTLTENSTPKPPPQSSPLSTDLSDISTNSNHTSSMVMNGGHRHRRSSGQRLCGKVLVQAMQLVCNGQYNGPSISSSSMLAAVAAQPSSSVSAGNKMLRQVRRMVLTIHPQQQSPLPQSASTPSPQPSLRELANRLNISLARVYYENNKHGGYYASSTTSSAIDHQDDHETSIQTAYVPDEHSHRVRVRRGIVDECCYSSCSFQDMRQYCAVSTSNNDDQRFKSITTKSTSYHNQ
ncbi:hypothetical protein HUG17_7814 [Dermatophagoides farinae]|uniref:Insulin-like domain-containing protein n=2 Tax=Dermatophagoides farinae TaxID=6954 RepID=A0A9D4NYJ4_DERFA|nr:uncharacterized protein LOC124495511 [Dermatophagoides farinae]KAH7640347.1 hypothetical protein HUG17_7814 [Dermatophagoides farinae]